MQPCVLFAEVQENVVCGIWKKETAPSSRVAEGTLENLIEMDYIISQFPVKVSRMKPAIRNILRMSVYQLKYMDSVPDSAVCNEGGSWPEELFNLKGFVNGVLEVGQEIWTR